MQHFRYRKGKAVVERKGRLQTRQLLQLIANHTTSTASERNALYQSLRLGQDPSYAFRDEEDDGLPSLADLFAGLSRDKLWEALGGIGDGNFAKATLNIQFYR